MPDPNRDVDPSRSAPLGEPDARAAEEPRPTGAAAPLPLPNGAPPAGKEARRDLVAKPLLASEVLIEELAPVEPGRRAARLWCAALAFGFTLLGALSLLGVRAGGLRTAVPSFVLGALALLEAALPVPYRQRATAMVILGVLAAMLGLRGAGPAMNLWVAGEGWGLLRLVAAVALPAALLFRAQYRAYRPARWILAGAFACAMPYAAYAVSMLLGPGSFGLARVGAIAALAAIGLSLLGFMGAETTGAGTYTSPGIVVALPVEFALTVLGRGEPISAALLTETVASAIALAGTCATASLGLFQMLAWRLAADARRIDLHAKPAGDPPTLGRSGEDWSAHP